MNFIMSLSMEFGGVVVIDGALEDHHGKEHVSVWQSTSMNLDVCHIWTTGIGSVIMDKMDGKKLEEALESKL